MVLLSIVFILYLDFGTKSLILKDKQFYLKQLVKIERFFYILLNLKLF